MSVRAILERLEEATYERDRGFRADAERFFDALNAFFKSKERTGKAGDPVKYKKGKGLVVKSADVLPGSIPFDVVLEEFSLGGAEGAAGIVDGKLVLIVYALPPKFAYPRDLKKAASILEDFREVVVHEMVHILDRQRMSGNVKATSPSSDGKASYYNSPGEWNAYWQAGASELERHLGAVARGEEKSLGLKTVDDIKRQARKFWKEGFLRNMDAKVQRKFDKRLAALWTAMKDQGMI